MHSLQQIVIPSAALNAQAPVAVLLPWDAGAGRRYPVLYLLHSLAGRPSPQICHALRTRLLDLPFIIVLPDGDRSFYINTYDGRCYEDFIIDELIPTIDESFPSIALRGCRAVGGPSMGGFGALMLGLRRRDCFGVVYSQSGAIAASRWVTDGPSGCVFGPPDSTLRDSYDLYRLIDMPGDLPALYLDCGLDDFLLSENREFHAFLTERQIPHIYREHMSEHPGAYLNDASHEALSFVQRSVSMHEVQHF